MRITFDNRLMTSFLLYLDHEIQKQGVAFSNYSGRFYPVATPYQNLYAYAAPFRQLVNDTSISGATVMTGVYLNNTFVTVGTSGLHSINHYKGTVYFNTPIASSVIVSGRYAIKDVNVELTDQEEQKLIFETKYEPKNKYGQSFTGLASDVKTLPSIFIKYEESDAIPVAFGGIRDNKITLKCLFLAENEFQKIAVNNILKGLCYRNLPIVTGSLPFDYAGNYTGLNYNYDALSLDTAHSPIILDSRVKDVPLVGEFANMTPRVSRATFLISTFMSDY